MFGYFEYTIENDEGNNINLYSHKIHSKLAQDGIEQFGVFSDELTNTVTLRSKTKLNKKELESFLQKEISEEEKTVDFNDGETLLVSAGFKDSHKDRVQIKPSSVSKEQINEKGYVDSFYFEKGQLFFTISRKPVVPISFFKGTNTRKEHFRVDYKAPNRETGLVGKKRIQCSVNTFVFRNLKNIDKEKMFHIFVCGIGCKKSYGICRVEKV